MPYFNFDNNQDNPNENEEFSQADYSELDITIDDPEETLQRYYEAILSASTKQEIFNILEGFQKNTEQNTLKGYLVDEIGDKVAWLQEIEHGN